MPYIDLDNFKPVNDTLGHGVGDKPLVAVTGRLSKGVRSEDTLARLGGGEFTVLLEEVGTRTRLCRSSSAFWRRCGGRLASESSG